jgi:hypothetical protein
MTSSLFTHRTQGDRSPSHRCVYSASFPEAFDGVAFQRQPSFVIQGSRQFHVTGCGSQLSNLITPFHRCSALRAAVFQQVQI